MKTYKAYKDSGIKWIGEIPEHWKNIKLAYVGEFKKGRGISKKDIIDIGVDVILYGDIYTKYNIATDKLERRTSDIVAEKSERIFEGDLLMTGSGETAEEIGKTVVYLSEKEAYAGGDVIILRPKRNYEYKYLSYCLNAPEFFHERAKLAKGDIVVHIYSSQLRNLKIPIPPKAEQEQIASFLDQKTAEIDTSIKKLQNLIELLKEERVAIINEAVTKGINPDVKMKNSGIKWIGQIPEHWEVNSLKWLIDGRLKYGANESANEENLSDPRYIRITDFGNDGKLKDGTFKSLSLEKAKDYFLAEGDILFARSGATVGKTFQFKNYKGLACYAGYLIKAVPDASKIISDFLYLFTKTGSYDEWKNSIFIQATIQNIGADKYQYLKVSQPPIDEQVEIVKHIENETTRIDREIKYSEREIELLKEYKQSLITEVVTGKIDVRDYQLTA